MAKNYQVYRKMEENYACFDRSRKLEKLMKKLSRIGFKLGEGLGKNKQGIVNPVMGCSRFSFKSGLGFFKEKAGHRLVYILVEENDKILKIEQDEGDNGFCEPEAKKLKIEKT